ncbi:MAG: polymer-forming cytoskeletal protein [Deltaproteobacteria bacterium]|nr:MAG: polymer-forming cytoskeletal protein [Deltaproteobacteria bacterium]
MKKPKDEINAFLGKDTEFEGKFSFTGAVRIDGKLSGEIFSNGTLIVGESAIIKSQIHVAEMIISGEVHGDIFAEKKIEITVPGKLFGNIQTPKLVLEEGVIFEGNCKMKDLKEEKKKDPDLSPKKTEGLSILK